jgi:hypothetical protein
MLILAAKVLFQNTYTACTEYETFIISAFYGIAWHGTSSSKLWCEFYNPNHFFVSNN